MRYNNMDGACNVDSSTGENNSGRNRWLQIIMLRCDLAEVNQYAHTTVQMRLDGDANKQQSMGVTLQSEGTVQFFEYERSCFFP